MTMKRKAAVSRRCASGCGDYGRCARRRECCGAGDVGVDPGAASHPRHVDAVVRSRNLSAHHLFTA